MWVKTTFLLLLTMPSFIFAITTPVEDHGVKPGHHALANYALSKAAEEEESTAARQKRIVKYVNLLTNEAYPWVSASIYTLNPKTSFQCVDLILTLMEIPPSHHAITTQFLPYVPPPYRLSVDEDGKIRNLRLFEFFQNPDPLPLPYCHGVLKEIQQDLPLNLGPDEGIVDFRDLPKEGQHAFLLQRFGQLAFEEERSPMNKQII